MKKIKDFFGNKWVGFALATILYVLWFVLWTGNWWMLLGVIVIYDLYISRLFYRYVWSKNARLCEKSPLYRSVYEWVNAIVFATVVASIIHLFRIPDVRDPLFVDGEAPSWSAIISM